MSPYRLFSSPTETLFDSFWPRALAMFWVFVRRLERNALTLKEDQALLPYRFASNVSPNQCDPGCETQGLGAGRAPEDFGRSKLYPGKKL